MEEESGRGGEVMVRGRKGVKTPQDPCRRKNRDGSLWDGEEGTCGFETDEFV